MNQAPWENPISTEEISNISAFEPRKIWLMKCNLKQLGTVAKSIRFLVVADDYATAKSITNNYASENSSGKTFVSNIAGSEVAHDYMLMIEQK